MTKEEAIDHFIKCRANLKNQNEIFRDTMAEELKDEMYENEIRISELNRVIDYLKGDW